MERSIQSAFKLSVIYLNVSISLFTIQLNKKETGSCSLINGDWQFLGLFVEDICSRVHATKLAHARPRLGPGICCVNTTRDTNLGRAQDPAALQYF